jgi:hypothetical protein
MVKRVKYVKVTYKYKLKEDYREFINIFPKEDIITDFIILTTKGELIIRAGYAWDGCSGPTEDDDTNMRGGLKHDALYQLFRTRLLDLGWRETADNNFGADISLDSGLVNRPWGLGWWKYVDKFRAKYFRFGVHVFGEGSAAWQEEKILTAP